MTEDETMADRFCARLREHWPVSLEAVCETAQSLYRVGKADGAMELLESLPLGSVSPAAIAAMRERIGKLLAAATTDCGAT